MVRRERTRRGNRFAYIVEKHKKFNFCTFRNDIAAIEYNLKTTFDQYIFYFLLYFYYFIVFRWRLRRKQVFTSKTYSRNVLGEQILSNANYVIYALYMCTITLIYTFYYLYK